MYAELRSRPEQKSRQAAATKKWAQSNPEKTRKRNREQGIKLRQEAIQHYGGVCVCCGESLWQLLTIDHIDGGGNKHRIEVLGQNQGGYRFYSWLRREGWPDGFQTLCWNCNLGKAHYGVCPHQPAP